MSWWGAVVGGGEAAIGWLQDQWGSNVNPGDGQRIINEVGPNGANWPQREVDWLVAWCKVNKPSIYDGTNVVWDMGNDLNNWRKAYSDLINATGGTIASGPIGVPVGQMSANAADAEGGKGKNLLDGSLGFGDMWMWPWEKDAFKLAPWWCWPLWIIMALVVLWLIFFFLLPLFGVRLFKRKRRGSRSRSRRSRKPKTRY